jgi:hypothetical protein
MCNPLCSESATTEVANHKTNQPELEGAYTALCGAGIWLCTELWLPQIEIYLQPSAVSVQTALQTDIFLQV